VPENTVFTPGPPTESAALPSATLPEPASDPEGLVEAPQVKGGAGADAHRGAGVEDIGQPHGQRACLDGHVVRTDGAVERPGADAILDELAAEERAAGYRLRQQLGSGARQCQRGGNVACFTDLQIAVDLAAR
jgi:hypothetical protein